MRKAIIIATLLACVLVFAWAYDRERTIERGKQSFARYGCASCHYAGGAPSLQNVAKKYDRATLETFLADPQQVYRGRNGRPLNEKYGQMPKMGLAKDDISPLVAYLRDLSD